MVREEHLAGLRWLVLSGTRHEVFWSLGQRARGDIHAALEESRPDCDALRRWAETEDGKAYLEQVLATTSCGYGEQLAELEALADGAGVLFEDLLLTSLRGDLGVAVNMGCSDLGWRREGLVVAHNEDGDPLLDGRLMLLTLLVENEAAVTALWYPGALPVNAFVATGHGLVWGVNHIPVVRPFRMGAGRHFVARALQRATTLDAAVDHLRSHPAVGGFTYTIGERDSGRVAVVEAVAGRVAVVEATWDEPLHWHTNHLRHLPDPPDVPLTGQHAADGRSRYEESVARGRVLASLQAGRAEPSNAWFLNALTSATLPHGVYRSATGSDPLMTLCTVVADLHNNEITVRGSRGRTCTVALSDFTHGTATTR
ncbi:C45 family peptidase [Streptomyces sp. NPDC020096]